MHAVKTESGKWRARGYNKFTKRTKSFTCDTKKEAERLARLYQYESKKYNPSEMTFGEAYDMYSAAKQNSWSPKTAADRKRWRETKYVDLIDLPLSKLTDEFLQIYVDDMAKSVSPKTVCNVFSPIKTVVRRYAKRRPDVELPQVKRPKLDLPSEATVAALLQLVEEDSKFCVPVYLAAYGCMRRGEIASLDMDHIDFKNKTIFIEHNKVLNDKREWVLKSTKNGEPRKIKVPDIILEKIKKHGLPDISNPDDFSNQFGKFIKKNDIPHLRFHDLRHFCAARMLSIPLPISVVQEYGGWKDETTLMKIYDYVIEEIRDSSMQKWQEYVNATCQKLAKAS